MNPTTPDDAELDRLLTERLAAEVEDVTAGPALLVRIRTDARAKVDSGRAGRLGRPSARLLWPIAAAAAVLVAVALVTGGGEDDADVATGADLDVSRSQVLLSGEAGGEQWSVVEYVEEDAQFVDEPTTCLRFEPAVEDGPFFCGTEEDLVGAHGRLVPRRSVRFNDHAVFAGVFAPQVAEVSLRVAGEQIVVEPTPWPGPDLGVVVIMLPVPDGVEYDVGLTDAEGEVLSVGGGSAAEGTPGADVPAPSSTTTEARTEGATLDEAGGVDGPVLYAAVNESGEAEGALIVGTVVHDDGCLFLVTDDAKELDLPPHLLLWQYGTRWSASPPGVILPDGAVVEPGDRIEGGGGYHRDASAFTNAPAVASAVDACLVDRDRGGDAVAVLQGTTPSVIDA